MHKTKFDPSRSLEAQAKVYATMLDELNAGEAQPLDVVHLSAASRPRPQLKRALLRPDGIGDARAFDLHPVLGAQLRHCSALVLTVSGGTANQILGAPDDLKLRSSMTLFEVAVPDVPVCGAVLRHFYGAAQDELTLMPLQGWS